MSDEENRNSAGDPADEEAPSLEEKARAEAAAKAKAEAAARAKAAKEAAEAAKPPWEKDPKAPEISDASGDPLVESLRQKHPRAVGEATATAGDLALVVSREEIREVCASLKEEHGFHLLVDICGADYPEREEARFEVIYHVYSLEANRRVRLKVEVPEGEDVPSVTPVWRGADWCEREAYDMYGIRFAGHPDMTRILLWEGFHGYPLRKDFPVEGVDTGSAIYPEYYEADAGPVAGTGTGWKPPEPPSEDGAETEDDSSTS
jgi:NADH-quinone oxidoreductase subunit C